MGLHPDFKDLLSAFDVAKVEYLLVGGYAVGFHSRPRFTKDIDLWILNEPQNLRRAYDALASFGAPDTVLEALRHLRPDEILFMGAPPTRVDVLASIPGLEFRDAYSNRVKTEWDGVAVSVIGLDDLIVAKRASGRDQDQLDVRMLEQAKAQKRSPK